MSCFLKVKQELPTLGIGLGLRRELLEETLASVAQIDWLELVPESYMGIGGRKRETLQKVLVHFPLISHGVNLSIGSTDELNVNYLRSLKILLDEINAPWWSDHLCFSSIDGVYMHDLLPLPFSWEAVNHIVDRVKKVQDFTERPFLLENISYYMQMPGCEMSEAQFIGEVLEKADCGLLLDVNNVYVNSVNHRFDPHQFIDQLPIERTVQIHMAGHKLTGEVIIDTHGAPVIEPVYALLEEVLKRTTVNAVMLERDQNFPEFCDILAELETIRKLVKKSRPNSLRDQKQDCTGSQKKVKGLICAQKVMN